MTRKRSAAILIESDHIALIERHRLDRHYFVFPGGGVEANETPEQAVIREVEEELGVQIAVRKLVAELWYHGVPQYYFLVESIGGEFGAGQGEEYTEPQPPEVGTYTPVWMPMNSILQNPVLPTQVAELVLRRHPQGWAGKPLRLYDPRPD
jgi:8-oxo-dGTP pyrophosphatase MutT (NUDIX family)